MIFLEKSLHSFGYFNTSMWVACIFSRRVFIVILSAFALFASLAPPWKQKSFWNTIKVLLSKEPLFACNSLQDTNFLFNSTFEVYYNLAVPEGFLIFNSYNMNQTIPGEWRNMVPTGLPSGLPGAPLVKALLYSRNPKFFDSWKP